MLLKAVKIIREKYLNKTKHDNNSPFNVLLMVSGSFIGSTSTAYLADTVLSSKKLQENKSPDITYNNIESNLNLNIRSKTQELLNKEKESLILKK